MEKEVKAFQMCVNIEKLKKMEVGGVAQMVEHFPSKFEALSLNSHYGNFF
jgi:hypothetical protein